MIHALKLKHKTCNGKTGKPIEKQDSRCRYG